MVNPADAVDRGDLNARIGLVIGSKQCPGVQLARDRGFVTEVLPGVIPAAELEQLLRRERIAWVVLAGYLKMLELPPAFEGRVVTIHPALLPRHGRKGMYGLPLLHT